LNLEKLVKYSLPVFVIAIVSRAIEAISFFYYAVPVMCVLFIVAMLKSLPRIHSGVKVQNNSNSHLPSSLFHPSSLMLRQTGLPSLLFLLPGTWFLLTSLWSSYPAISAMRSLYFMLLSGGCLAAGILWIRYSGKSVLDFLLPANIFIVTLSLFSLITNIPSDSWTGGNGKGFMGFFGQQNLLASVILFTLPAVIFRIAILAKLRIRNPASSIWKLTTYYLLLTVNLLLLALTYSRASILSLLFGVLIYLLLNKKWKIIFYTLSASALLAVIIYITPSLNNLTGNIINKDFPEFYTSRMWMWEPSYRAAVDGGLIGLGYGISDPDEKVGGMGDHFEGDRFIREKGNSILALVEESGLIGLALFVLPLIVMIVKIKISGIQHSASSILIASLAAFLLHSQFEAWCVGVGSVQLPLFFIYIGLAIRTSKPEVLQ
jgi:O-antigen ligase